MKEEKLRLFPLSNRGVSSKTKSFDFQEKRSETLKSK